MRDCMVSDQDGCCLGCGLSIASVLSGSETCSQKRAVSMKEPKTSSVIFDSPIPDILQVGRIRATELIFREL